MNIINLQTNEITSKRVILDRLNNEIKDFFKRKTNNPKASLFDDIYQWTGKYWAKIDKDEFENQCENVLLDFEMSSKDKKDILKNFILNNLINESEIDMYSRYFFCMNNCVLCFKENFHDKEINASPLHGKRYITKTSDSGYEFYILSHEECKDFHLTHSANISFKKYEAIKSESINIWKLFINRLIPSLELEEDSNGNSNKKEIIEWFNKFIFSLISGTDGNAFFVNLLGPAQCGKTTLVNFLINSLGNYVYTMSKEDLSYSQLENSYTLYTLKDARLLIYSEASRKPFNASFIKEITGGTQFNYGEHKFKINARLLIDSNYMLRSEAKTDNAFYERYVMIPVGPSVPREERDLTLEDKLFEARNDIFSWLVFNYNCKSITIPEKSDFYKKLMQFSLSPVQVFYQSCFVGYDNLRLGAYLKLTYARKEEDIWTFYINYFHKNYARMLKTCPFFNYSEEYANELLNIHKSDFISELAKLHKNVSTANSGNTVKFRFDEIYFNTEADIESMSLIQAFYRNVKYSETFKSFRNTFNMVGGVGPIMKHPDQFNATLNA